MDRVKIRAEHRQDLTVAEVVKITVEVLPLKMLGLNSRRLYRHALMASPTLGVGLKLNNSKSQVAQEHGLDLLNNNNKDLLHSNKDLHSQAVVDLGMLGAHRLSGMIINSNNSNPRNPEAATIIKDHRHKH